MTDTDNTSGSDADKALFAHLVIMFTTSAMQHMGKIVDPATQKASVNLDAAQTSIDMLDMLERKTRGHLDADEQRMLTESLSSLKLTFVETQSAAPAPTSEPAPASEPAAEAPPPEGAPAAEPGTIETPKSDATVEKEPKFHKKYD